MTKNTAYQTIADSILSKLQSGIYSVGDKLPSERHLSKEMNVSRTIIREAKAILKAQGIIENKRGSGAIFLRQTPTWEPKPNSNIGEIEIAEARKALESPAVALSALSITDETLEDLETYINIMSGQVRSTMTPDQADKAFHIAIAKATKNKVIESSVAYLWNLRSEPISSLAIRGTASDTGFNDRISEHWAILDALKNRDAKAAQLAMQNHCEQVQIKFMTQT